MLSAKVRRYSVGVPPVIFFKYWLKEDFARMFEGPTTGKGLDEATVRKAMELRPGYLRCMFAAIVAKYGTVESFFEKELGMGPEQLKLLKQNMRSEKGG
jgi:protein-tyrosine phosphatase